MEVYTFLKEAQALNEDYKKLQVKYLEREEAGMNISLFLKTGVIWFLIAVLAVGNGVFRQSVLVPGIGHSLALPLSGIILSVIVFAVTCLFFSFFGKQTVLGYFLIGVQWVVMTLVFEFMLGHYLLDRSLSEILQVFDIMNGDFFLIVLLVSLFSPLLSAKIKGALDTEGQEDI